LVRSSAQPYTRKTRGTTDKLPGVGDAPSDDDPGWPSPGQILRALVPGYLQTLSRRGDQLVALRAVFVSFSSSLVLFGVVLAFIGTAGETHVMPWLALVLVAAVATSTGARVTAQPLDCTSEATLARTYRTRFFLTMAFSQSVALFGFVFAFIGAPVWIYDIAAVFAILRMWTAEPPTPQRLAQHQAALEASGCQVSLVAALRRTPPPRV
jgi:F0F1-type ATP synthase membrane subunit c/vacuolar-type H+-ATPase subunit K